MILTYRKIYNEHNNPSLQMKGAKKTFAD